MIFGVCFLECVFKYCKNVFGEAFAIYGEDLANAIIRELKKEPPDERRLVEGIATALNGKKLSSKDICANRGRFSCCIES